MAARLTLVDLDELERIVERAVERALIAQRAPVNDAARDRLTVREAARELRCSDSQVRKLIASGRLRAEQLAKGGSSRVFIRRGEIERLLSESARL